MKIDKHCVEIRAVSGIFLSKKTLNDKVRLLSVYIPTLKNFITYEKIELDDETKIYITINTWLTSKTKKCIKYFDSMNIRDVEGRKLIMDELLGLNRTLSKIHNN